MLLDSDSKRLRWACRRGMLELDLVLQPYVEKAYDGSSDRHKELFCKLLAEADQDLFIWFTQRETPKDSELADIVKVVLEYTQL
ncbi:response regulator receiver protein [Piscirickettsia salmonis]|uniref:FAD assembly factor SdhE n=2 Tax=Piscirickettsia salmonis TaxID=1238 RepID=A0A9Q5V887_PISSA|nr:succinate dehydrogenase assembly factor 2 [Piscirickettsia salmonis]ALA24670.1 flavinator of succinate dehydrogenase family protein [Piscirickettsia salmonis]APS45010.1 response regulator receiver protein [Piscirickettsia salmonis]APS48370.1 response regulator receiver protein [Piscirickettsia salmonis]APS49630.1 response regulator receiver protein [Piscirickettsia salmonis]APS52811.1 response regulator receiver protein [Piscirickettsia salmonis]